MTASLLTQDHALSLCNFIHIQNVEYILWFINLNLFQMIIDLFSLWIYIYIYMVWTYEHRLHSWGFELFVQHKTFELLTFQQPVHTGALNAWLFSLRHAQFGQWVWLESHLKLPVRGWLPLTSTNWVFLLKLLNDWSVSLMTFLGPRSMYIPVNDIHCGHWLPSVQHL